MVENLVVVGEAAVDDVADIGALAYLVGHDFELVVAELVCMADSVSEFEAEDIAVEAVHWMELEVEPGPELVVELA